MKVHEFTDAAEFLRAAEPILLAREAEHSLMLGVVLRVRGGFQYGEEPPLFACVDDDEAIALLASRTPPHSLLLAPVTERAQEAAEALASHLAAGGCSLPSVQGMVGVVDAFADAWKGRTSAAAAVGMHQRLYRLTEVAAPSAVSGRLRWALSKDVPVLSRWVEAFAAEATPNGPPPNPEALLRRLIGREDASLALWEDEGRPVSMASGSRPTPHGVSVSLVYTPPALRDRGYASACVAGLSQKLLDSGKEFCTLFTDLSNPTSNRLYQRIGYRPIADFREIRFFALDDGCSEA